MRTLKYMFLALIFLLLVGVVVGLFLPSKVEMQRSAMIDRTPEKIYAVINSLNNFNNWSPWVLKDKQAVYQYSGSENGIGSIMTWKGNNQVGQGSQEIVDSKQNEFVKTKIYFGKSRRPAFTKLLLIPENGKTKVTWTFESDAGNDLLARYFGLATEELLAPDYELGLKNLKEYVEALPLYDYSNLSIIQAPSQKVYQVEGQSTMQQDEMSSAIASSYEKIVTFLTENDISMTGSPKIINKNYQNDVYQFIAAIPVDNNEIVDENNQVKASNMPHGKVIKLVHKGEYDSLPKSYKILNAYIYEKKLSINGSAWEDYVTDPSIVEDSELVTHIYQPIK